MVAQVLSNILKERAGKDWEAEFNMEDNEKDAGETPPDAHLYKLAGISHHRRREQDRCGHLYKAFTKCHIFQDRLIGEAPYVFKQCAPDEKGLIAINDAAASTAKVIEKRNECQPPVTARKLMHETAGLNGEVRLHFI